MEERLLDGGQPAGLPVSGSVTLTERVKAFFDERVYQPFMNVVKVRVHLTLTTMVLPAVQ
jgi:hypothetical protein